MFFPSGDKFDPFDAFRNAKRLKERHFLHLLARGYGYHSHYCMLVTRLESTAMGGFKNPNIRSLFHCLFLLTICYGAKVSDGDWCLCVFNVHLISSVDHVC